MKRPEIFITVFLLLLGIVVVLEQGSEVTPIIYGLF